MAVIIENMKMPKSCGVCAYNNSSCWCSITKSDIDRDFEFRERLNDCPLKEVPSGKWVKHETYTSCSECGKVYPYRKVTHKFCPNCGAQMEQTGENTDESTNSRSNSYFSLRRN